MASKRSVTIKGQDGELIPGRPLRWILARQHNPRKSRPFIPKVVSFRIGRNQPAAGSATPNAGLLPSAPRPRKNHQGDQADHISGLPTSLELRPVRAEVPQG